MNSGGGFGFSPADFDVDECTVEVLGKLEKGCAVDFNYLLTAVSSMVNGDLTYNHLTLRVLVLRGQRKVFLLKDKIKGKTVSLYRLRLPTDDEKPTWTSTSSK